MSERNIDRVSLYGASNLPARPLDHEFFAQHRAKTVLIYSAERRAYWRPGGCGYTAIAENGGRWIFEEAYRQTAHFGPEKGIHFELAAGLPNEPDYERGYTGHGRGVVVTNDGSGKFSERPMTPGELAAREPAWAIGVDPYACAAFVYIRAWEVIAPAIDAALAAQADALTREVERRREAEEALRLAAERFDNIAKVIEKTRSYANVSFYRASAERCRHVANGGKFGDPLDSVSAQIDRQERSPE